MPSRSVRLAARLLPVALMGVILATSGFQLAGRLIAARPAAASHPIALAQWKSSSDVRLALSGAGQVPQPSPPSATPSPAPSTAPAAPAAAARVAQPGPAPVLSAAPPRAAPPPPVRPPPPPPPPPSPRLVIGSTQQALINSDRESAGRGPLNWSSCLAAIAARQARAMASAGTIFHGQGVYQDWGCHLGSVQTGENVGVWGGGINDSAINQLFMGSAPHRANIMGPYHWVGTAWVVGANGSGYIAVEFA